MPVVARMLKKKVASLNTILVTCIIAHGSLNGGKVKPVLILIKLYMDLIFTL